MERNLVELAKLVGFGALVIGGLWLLEWATTAIAWV